MRPKMGAAEIVLNQSFSKLSDINVFFNTFCVSF